MPQELFDRDVECIIRFFRYARKLASPPHVVSVARNSIH